MADVSCMDLGRYQVQFLGRSFSNGQEYEMVCIVLFALDDEARETELAHHILYIRLPARHPSGKTAPEIRKCLRTEQDAWELWRLPEYSRVRIRLKLDVIREP